MPEPTFFVRPLSTGAHRCLYSVTQLGGDILVTFTAVVRRSQAEAAEPSDTEAIRQWCEHHPEQLPPRVGAIYIDLHYPY